MRLPFLIMRKIGSSNVGGSLRCPRCKSTEIKRIDEIGDIDLYKCRNWKTNVVTGEWRRCGVEFRYHRVPMKVDMPRGDIRKKPQLVLGPSAKREIAPIWKFLDRMKRIQKPVMKGV